MEQLSICWISSEEQSKVRMRLQVSWISVSVCAFVDDQRTVHLQKRIQSIQNTWTTEVGVVQNKPVSLLHCLDQKTVEPAELDLVSLVQFVSQNGNSALDRKSINLKVCFKTELSPLLVSRLYAASSMSNSFRSLANSEISLDKSSCSYPPRMSILSISLFMENSYSLVPRIPEANLISSVFPELEGPTRINGHCFLTQRRRVSKTE
ncbi:hypothetical protein OGAPHI_005736 [Ogataea philodendri]|uniref:Uncharacterized protein n=1 Tax=Ogataea philodendri TaxID=1378263 RepID=A0A9P8NZT1_9ASCO|nr:uncharacterized protein OGAPHI_005736 [Ogataea philodendri]KAH3662484.1 hypothetical protein OGAPHI_005736 [Ogataea philodendri]